MGNFVLNVELSVSDWAMLKAMLTLGRWRWPEGGGRRWRPGRRLWQAVQAGCQAAAQAETVTTAFGEILWWAQVAGRQAGAGHDNNHAGEFQ